MQKPSPISGQNRSQFTQSADDAGLSYALVDDQLDDAEFP